MGRDHPTGLVPGRWMAQRGHPRVLPADLSPASFPWDFQLRLGAEARFCSSPHISQGRRDVAVGVPTVAIRRMGTRVNTLSQTHSQAGTYTHTHRHVDTDATLTHAPFSHTCTHSPTSELTLHDSAVIPRVVPVSAEGPVFPAGLLAGMWPLPTVSRHLGLQSRC